MSDDWKPGDLALCVDVRPFPSSDYRKPSGIERGRFYTVASVGVCEGLTALQLVGVATDTETGCLGAWRFIKVTPRTADAEDAETIRLLNGKPVRVEA